MTDLAQLDLARPVPRSAARAARPCAVVAVTAPPGTVPHLAPCLAALAVSEGLAGLRVRPGSLAVLVLAAGEGAESEVEAMAPGYAFPLRVEAHPHPTPGGAAARAAEWATTLGIPDAPVLLLDARHRVAPDWAYAAMAAIRDGADIVRGRAGLRRRLGLGLGLGARPPLAVRSAALLGQPAARLRRETV